MHIAIIGAGFPGLATAWQLLNLPRPPRITLIDRVGIGGGASGIAAGLMHPFTGVEAKLAFRGLEAMGLSKQLIEKMEESYSPDQKIIRQRGILRIPTSERQETFFHQTAQKYDQVAWLNQKRVFELSGGALNAPGILIPEGISINCKVYLQALWRACKARGAELILKDISTYEALKQIEADATVLTIGAGILNFPCAETLKVRTTRGHLIRRSWPKERSPLPFATSTKVYFTHDDEESIWIGGSYERGELSPTPDRERAERELLPHAIETFPFLKEQPTLECVGGMRASLPSHLPQIALVDEGVWVMTGFGSKGLLYHALYAKELCARLF